jgi:hypothetical protein
VLIVVNNLPDFHHIPVDRFIRWVDVLAANDDNTEHPAAATLEGDEMPDGLLSYY